MFQRRGREEHREGQTTVLKDSCKDIFHTPTKTRRSKADIRESGFLPCILELPETIDDCESGWLPGRKECGL